MMPLAAGELAIGHEERAVRLAPLAAKATLELSDTPCSMTGHGACAPSQHRNRRGGAGPPRRDAGLPLGFTGDHRPHRHRRLPQLQDQPPFLNVAVTSVPSPQNSPPTEPRFHIASSFPRAVP